MLLLQLWPVPPILYLSGRRTTDEMGDLWVQVVPDRPGDAAPLKASLERKLLFQNITGYQVMLKAEPDNVSLHDDLGILFAQAGDLERSAKQFAESLRLRPDVPAAHYNVGNALLGLGRWDQAERHFNAALTLDPGYRLAAQGFARSRLQPAASAPSFPSWQPVRSIDQVLVTDALLLTRYQVLDLRVSDHLPIAVEVQLPAACPVIPADVAHDAA